MALPAFVRDELRIFNGAQHWLAAVATPRIHIITAIFTETFHALLLPNQLVELPEFPPFGLLFHLPIFRQNLIRTLLALGPIAELPDYAVRKWVLVNGLHIALAAVALHRSSP
jgi:hypothetical protein